MLNRRVFLGVSLAGGASCVAVAQRRRVFRVADFGGSPEAAAEVNDLAVRRALKAATAAGEGDITFDAGRYRIAMRYPWEVTANVSLRGQGLGRTVLERADTLAFHWVDVSNTLGGHVFDGFTAVGNGRSTESGDGGFLQVRTDDRAQASMADILVANVELQNFRGDGWIWFLMLGRCRHGISRIRIDGSCRFISRAGNGRGPTDIGILSAAIIVQGNNLPGGAGDRIRDVVIGPVHADIPHIKSLAVIWGGVEQVIVDHPVIARCGTIGIASDCGAYAITVGNETPGAPNPDRVSILGPTIGACQSVGVYFVRWGGDGGICRFDGTGGEIANVTDRANGRLPKGAIAATDGATMLEIRNLRARNCIAAIDVDVAPGGRLTIDGVDASDIIQGGNGIRIGPHLGVGHRGVAPEIVMRNVTIRSSAPDVAGIRFGGGGPLGNVSLSGRIDLSASYAGLIAYDEGVPGRAPMFTFRWSGNAVIEGGTAGAIIMRGNASPVAIDATVTIRRGPAKGARDHRVKFDGMSNLEIDGSFHIEGVQAGDMPAWDARPSAGGSIRVRPGVLKIDGPASLQTVSGSAGS